MVFMGQNLHKRDFFLGRKNWCIPEFCVGMPAKSQSICSFHSYLRRTAQNSLESCLLEDAAKNLGTPKLLNLKQTLTFSICFMSKTILDESAYSSQMFIGNSCLCLSGQGKLEALHAIWKSHFPGNFWLPCLPHHTWQRHTPEPKGNNMERIPFLLGVFNYLRPMDRILCTQTVPDPERRNTECKLNSFQLPKCNCPIFQFHCSAWWQLQHKHHLAAFLALQRANFWTDFLINYICMLKPKIS